MPLLRFPTDRIVGTLDWAGSWTDEHGPVLATGGIEVPDDVGIHLDVHSLQGGEPTGGGSWNLNAAQLPLDLGFIRDLPRDAVESLTVSSAVEATFGAVAHLAPSLRRLYLPWTEFTDAVLPTVARLTGLVYLQTFGNAFTDRGVQQLATLVNLDHLYLEEESLTVEAFNFVAELPKLTRLGLQDVPLSESEIELLRARLPTVDIG